MGNWVCAVNLQKELSACRVY